MNSQELTCIRNHWFLEVNEPGGAHLDEVTDLFKYISEESLVISSWGPFGAHLHKKS